MPAESRVWMSHGDTVVALPPGFVPLAHTERCAIAAMGDDERRMYGVQFHPEVVHTEAGTAILENFLHQVAGDRAGLGDVVVRRRCDRADSRARSATANVLCALSGGVDSAVAATLVARAIGKQLTCIFVDTGLMRKDESAGVARRVPRRAAPQRDRDRRRGAFLARLAGITDPEEKRVRIGHEFIAIFEEESKKIPDVRFLVQGTLYPDVIESKTPGSKAGHKIKSHHNVGGLARAHGARADRAACANCSKTKFARSARCSGLPDAIVQRQPFPGPGLAVRIIGEVNRESIATVRAADWIVTSEIDAALDLSPRPWQYFAVLDAGAQRRRDGRRAHLREPRRRSRDHLGRRDDRGLGTIAARAARTHIDPYRERGPRREPRRVRHHVEAAGHGRVGVAACASSS